MLQTKVIPVVLILQIAATGEPRPISEAAAIPDIVQTDPHLGLKTIGRSYCGPASVANTIAWLMKKPGTDLGELVRKLASADYMDTHPDKGTGDPGATLEHIATGGTTSNHAWINVGCYTHDPDTDPSPRTGRTTNTQFVKLLPLESGTLAGKESRLPRPATGHLQMTGDMVVKRSVDIAIADAILILHDQRRID